KKEKEIILSYIELSQRDGNNIIDCKDDNRKGRLLDVGLDSRFINGLPSFKNKNCLAGKEFIAMNPTGEVHRCHSSKKYLGNLFTGNVCIYEKAERCEYDVCHCPYLGYRYVLENQKDQHK
ncbi:hypothetical protein ACFL45_08790, partial [Candidatus Neomarinimicrobiota bacterium]